MTNRKNRHSVIHHLSIPLPASQASQNNTQTPIQRTPGPIHHNHHHKGASNIIRTIGNSIHKIEKPIEHVATRAIKGVENVDNKLLNIGNNMMIPLIIVGGVVVYFVLTKK